MALNEDEKAAIRYYMGYPSLSRSRAISLGIPDATQTNFILEYNMDNVLVSIEPRIRRSLQELECIEVQLSGTRQGIEVKSVTGATHFRHREALEDLGEQYVQWVNTLADMIGAPVNPFSNRLNRLGYGSGMGGGVSEPC